MDFFSIVEATASFHVHFERQTIHFVFTRRCHLLAFLGLAFVFVDDGYPRQLRRFVLARHGARPNVPPGADGVLPTIVRAAPALGVVG